MEDPVTAAVTIIEARLPAALEALYQPCFILYFRKKQYYIYIVIVLVSDPRMYLVISYCEQKYW